jgi:transposase
MTFIAALRHDRISAPCVIDGPVNGEGFLAYVEQFLAPTLEPGDIVIMDNLGRTLAPISSREVRQPARFASAVGLFDPCLALKSRC